MLRQWLWALWQSLWRPPKRRRAEGFEGFVVQTSRSCRFEVVGFRFRFRFALPVRDCGTQNPKGFTTVLSAQIDQLMAMLKSSDVSARAAWAPDGHPASLLLVGP